jgi:hypothetical protein
MEEHQQEVQMPMQQPPIVGHTTEGALQYQLESQETAERVQHIINGEVQEWDDQRQSMQWVKRFESMVNKKGLNMIRGYLTLYLGGTKTFALSDLETEYIASQTMAIGNNIKSELMDNWTEYSVKDYASASFIIDIVCSAVYAVLKKGENANYLKFLRTTQQISEIQHHQNMSAFRERSEKRGIMDIMLGKRK